MLESVPTCIWLTRSKCLKYFGRSKTKYSLVAEIGSTWTNDPNHFSELNNLTKFGKKLSKPFIIISLAVLSWLSKIVDGVSLKRKTLSKLTNQKWFWTNDQWKANPRESFSETSVSTTQNHKAIVMEIKLLRKSLKKLDSELAQTRHENAEVSLWFDVASSQSETLIWYTNLF